jgi:hypothetical protein
VIRQHGVSPCHRFSKMQRRLEVRPIKDPIIFSTCGSGQAQFTFLGSPFVQFA